MTTDIRARARDLGVAPGGLPTGRHNAITDVAGVAVGQVTLVQEPGVRTGVTAIVPHPGNLFREKNAGAVYVGNGFGKLAGSVQVAELGTIETPIVLTNTLSVASGLDGAVGWTLDQPGNESVRSVNALVGEVNDGELNDIRGRHVTAEHVRAAIASATGGPVAEGTVGAGTGTVCFGWKGGIGTSSRLVGEHTVGALVQTNYGGALRIDGAPVGEHLSPDNATDTTDTSADGSCMLVLATDAPLHARNLERLAARAVFAMARTGASYSNGSGDIALAFSTSPEVREPPAPATGPLPNSATTPLFRAALDATEEAIYNSLFMATTVTGHAGTTRRAIPLNEVRKLLRTRKTEGE
ncbi:P1 family peptidase [Streptomyces boninensis]|uniref:DmpA family aminopeptidase n=1 Tax=Streptomyces boninensis TaxID=2039455 RepID=UPI003B20B9CC